MVAVGHEHDRQRLRQGRGGLENRLRGGAGLQRTGTTVLVATHDRHTVDRMQMRVIALQEGRVVRDEESSGYHDRTGEVPA